MSATTAERDRPQERTGDAPAGMASVVQRNVGAMAQEARRQASQAGWQQKIAETITRFAGSMTFVYLHLIAFGIWILGNLTLLPYVRPWDPTFVMLGMIASVEAIFLSTFILISQNAMSAAADRRAELDLQVNLLAEHEVTKLIELVSAIADKLGVATPAAAAVEEAKQDIKPEVVLRQIERRNESE
jgi:uncharacterized membrane protein